MKNIANSLNINGYQKMVVIAALVFITGVQFDRAEARMQGESLDRMSTQALDDRMNEYLNHDFFKLELLFQSRVRYSVENTGFQGGRTFQVPNIRIGARGNLDKNFYYGTQFNIVNTPALLDAFIGWRYNDRFRIQAGAMKPQVSADFIPNPVNHDFVDRSRLPSYFGVQRQIGIAATAEAAGFSLYTGVFNGNGLRTNDNNVFDLQARLAKSIPAGPGSLEIGMNGMYGEITGPPAGMVGSVERLILGADIRFDNQTVLLAGEYMFGDYASVNFDDTATLQGYYATAGYYTDYDVLFLGRWQQWFHSENSAYEGSKLTLGFKRFVTRLISVEMNFDAFHPETPGSDWQFGVTGNANFLF